MGVGTRVKVTEKNALQLLADYVQWKYGEDGVWQLEDQCTYNLDFDDENKVYKQILTWLMFERKDLRTGKTSVEEFVEKFVNRNNDLAKKILGMRNIITDTFLILKNKDNILIVEGSRRKKFMVQIFLEHSFMYAIGRSVEGRIYPWGDMYKFAGIVKLMKSSDEMLQETGLITPSLVKKCGDDDFGFLWEKNPPQTPIGILRIHGLLIVGRMLKGERWYKTAIIPKEIFQNMNNQTI